MASTNTFSLDRMIRHPWSSFGLSATMMAEILSHRGHCDSALMPPPLPEPFLLLLPPPPAHASAAAAPLIGSHSLLL